MTPVVRRPHTEVSSRGGLTEGACLPVPCIARTGKDAQATTAVTAIEPTAPNPDALATCTPNGTRGRRKVPRIRAAEGPLSAGGRDPGPRDRPLD
jgi:hypothetical protein